MENELDKIPKPKTKDFELVEITRINHRPHPYCITPQHIAYASDNYSGMLGEYAIVEAEKNGKASCGMYSNESGRWMNRRTFEYNRKCTATYHEHISDKVLAIRALVTGKEIKELDGIQEYLKSIQSKLLELKVDGIIFIKAKGDDSNGDNR